MVSLPKLLGWALHISITHVNGKLAEEIHFGEIKCKGGLHAKLCSLII